MPQISTNPANAKKLIDAGMPKNISAEDRAKLEAGWNEQARKREEAIAKETKTPDVASLTLRYQLRKFGKHWNAFVQLKNSPTAPYVPLLPAPSLLVSAMDALNDKMAEEASKL